ncbi:hypothetical protein M2168_006245 [Streptomyces sp. CZ24]|nr:MULTISPECIES: hypothetical protein [Streptomyces]MBV1957479.1 hypothetical protein [Streptomyces sp. BV333]MDH6193127.1 hypothetical protein [Streptomyces sp. CZ24]
MDVTDFPACCSCPYGWWHPYWATAPSMPTARSELRHLVRTHGVARAV